MASVNNDTMTDFFNSEYKKKMILSFFIADLFWGLHKQPMDYRQNYVLMQWMK